MQSETYVQIILALAPLTVVMLALRAIQFIWPEPNKRWALALAGLVFALSFTIDRGPLAGLLVVPWLGATLYMGWRYWQTWWLKKDFQLAKLSTLASFSYLPVGAAWAFADRMALQPMDFSPIIVLLTGVHFHYAGFALPIISALILAKQSRRPKYHYVLAWGIILGIPLVALGISTSQYQLPIFIEVAAVTIMAGAGLGLGLLYLRQALHYRQWTKGLFLLGGLALSIGMCLALLYGWRYVLPLPFLSIPWMYAVHGSLNSLGFTLPVLLGWNIESR